jgi:membrane-bound serine protease (ClpP class)
MAMARLRAFIAALPLLMAVFAVLPGLAAPVEQQSPGTVPVGELKGVVNPVMVRYVDRVIEQAEQRQAPLVIFTMDTPGGLESSMRDIVQRILAARVPTVVFVYPNGARAGSAGVYIVYASHVAAMAPSTNIGSAHPVMMGEGGESQNPDSTMMEKLTNDAVALIRSLATTRNRNVDWAEQAVRSSANLPAHEALDAQVVDVVAEDVPALLSAIDGRVVRVGAQDVQLATRGLTPEPAPMTLLERFFHTVTDPTIAYLLMSIGGLALIYELANPGAILPGVVGGIMVILGLFALGTLELNAAGAGFILFGIVLLIADLMIAGTGALTVGSVVSFALGSLLLATSARAEPYLNVSIGVFIAMTLVFAAFAGVLAAFMMRSIRRPAPTPTERLLGQTGVAQTEVGEDGTVFVAGELWLASAADPATPIPAEQKVRVIAAKGLRLTVRPE